MYYCPNCNNPLAEGAQFCVFCGQEIAPPTPKPTFCYKCGKPLEEGAQFCVYCGANLDILPVAQQAVPEVPAAPEPQTSLDPLPEEPALLVTAAACCPYCGAEYEEDSLFCFRCGAQREDLPQTTPAEEPIPAFIEESIPIAAEEIPTPPPVKSSILPSDYQPPKKKHTGLIIGVIAAMIVLVVGMVLLGGPGTPMGWIFENNGTPAEPTECKDIHLTVAVEEWEEGWLLERVDAFNAQHPEYSLTVDTVYISSHDAGNVISLDPVAAPDVYMYSSDQVHQLVDAGALAPLEGEYLDYVNANMGPAMVDSATAADGSVYGFPYHVNSWFMYYDKSVYSEEEIGSLEVMLEQGGVSFPVNNGWYLGAFYAAGGATFFGEHGVDAGAGIRLYNGSDVTVYLTELVKHPNFYPDTDQNATYGMMESGRVSVLFSGSWSFGQVYEIWGENTGVAVVPTIQLYGMNYQLQPFAGSNCIGVNPHAEDLDAAYLFAAFLTSEESQLARYQMAGNAVYPTHLALLNNSTIMADPVAYTLLETSHYAATVQPTIPEMVYYWTPANKLGTQIVNREVTRYNAESMTKEFETAINGG